MRNFSLLKDELSTPRKIVVTTHARPDADALGSSLAIYQFLRKKGHDVHVITPTDYPDFLKWMQYEQDVIIYTNDKIEADELIKKADFTFCLDFSGKNRIGEMEEPVFKSNADKILIDHHLDADRFAKFELWIDTASSTCELVFDFIKMFEEPGAIDVGIGECIYAGMVTDTGSFRFASTSKAVHLIVSELLEIGINHSKVHQLIYDNNTESRLRLLGYALSEKMTILEDQHTAFISLSKEDLKRFKAKNGDTEGVVNYALSMEGIVFAALFKEADDMIKISFRSKGDFPANLVAKNYFNGGGHRNAAGGRSDISLNDTLKLFESILPEFKTDLENNYAETH